VLPTVPRQLAVIVDRALAFDQRDRWPDALLMREAVRAFVEGAGLRLEGHVLDTAEEAKARPITLPIEGEAPQPSARPLPAAGRQVYTPGAPGVPMAEAHWRAAGAPPAIEASAGGMSLDGLMADADDGDDDAATRLRDPTVQGRAAPPSYFPRADEGAPRAYGSAPLPPSAPNPMPSGAYSGAMGSRGAPYAASPSFGQAPDDAMGDRPTTALPSTATYGNPAGDRPTAALPSSPPYANATADRNIALAPSLTPAFHMGDRPITMAPTHTPSFATASAVAPEGTFGFAPRSTRIAPFVVLGAVAVLGGLAALVIVDGRSSTPASQPTASATAPAVPATPAPPPSTPPTATTEPAPTSTASAAASTAPAASSAAAATSKPQPSAPTASPTPKTPPSATTTTTQKRPPPAGSSTKGDPFSSRKW
jgi:hypothetical protein